MGGVSDDRGVAFDFDGLRKGWRLFLGNGLLGVHKPGPYLAGGKKTLRRLCKAAARRGWGGLVALATRVEPETAAWLAELDERHQEPMATALSALAQEL